MIIFISSILKIEKTNSFQILGVAFSFIGVVLIITKANLGILLNLDFNKGDITMVFGMLSWATYSALLKKNEFAWVQSYSKSWYALDQVNPWLSKSSMVK